MKKTVKKAALPILLLLIAIGYQALNKSTPSTTNTPTEPISIGWVGPLTGDAASFGQDALLATQLAVDELNSSGGINGRNIKLVAEDTQCNTKLAATAGEKLIKIDNVALIIGGLCSGETNAIAPLAEQSKTVLFSYCSGASNITSAGDYTFRTYPSDANQGKFAADYVYNTLKITNVATLAVLGDYGSGLKQTFEKRFQELGGKIILSLDYTQDQVDFRTDLTKIKNSPAKLIYAPGYPISTIPLLRQSTELDISIPFLAADTWEDIDIYQHAFANGIMYTTPATKIIDSNWIKKMEEKGGQATTCAPYAYTNMMVIGDILRNSNLSPDSIKNSLYNIREYPSIIGAISIDQNGDVEAVPYIVKKVINNKPEVIHQ